MKKRIGVCELKRVEGGVYLALTAVIGIMTLSFIMMIITKICVDKKFVVPGFIFKWY